MKRSGMSQDDLLFMFKTVIRPVLDFATVAYHTMLTKSQSERLERLQKRAIKIICGVNKSYNSAIEEGLIERLEERRENTFLKFTVKASNNPLFKEKWFPLNPETDYNVRNRKKYREFHSKTDRLQKSPLFQMRRRLNNE